MQVSAWDVAAVGIKAILYAATLCAAGAEFFLVYCAALVSDNLQRQIRRWVGLCVALALVASAVRLIVLAGSMGDGAGGFVDGAMLRMVLQAGEARATGIRIGGLLLTGTVLISHGRRPILAPLGAILAATSFAWIGHAWAAKTGGASIALLSLHLLGVAFWLGALVPLRMMVRAGDLPALAAAAARFGHGALWVVFILIAAGATLLWILLGTLWEPWTSPYGRAVMIKLGLVVCLLSVGAFNKLRLTPRLRAHDRHAAMSLGRSIQVEMILGGLILMVTAIFTTLMGPPALE